MTQLTTADRIAMVAGGGLVVLGVVLVGLLEILLGSPHPVDSEGAIVHEALIPIEVRSYVILLGLLILGLVAVYKFVAAPNR